MASLPVNSMAVPFSTAPPLVLKWVASHLHRQSESEHRALSFCSSAELLHNSISGFAARWRGLLLQPARMCFRFAGDGHRGCLINTILTHCLEVEEVLLWVKGGQRDNIAKPGKAQIFFIKWQKWSSLCYPSNNFHTVPKCLFLRELKIEKRS